jgi:hypothetical protein
VNPLRSKRRERAAVAQQVDHVAPARSLIAGGGELLISGAHGFELALAIPGIVNRACSIGLVEAHERIAALAPSARSPVRQA